MLHNSAKYEGAEPRTMSNISTHTYNLYINEFHRDTSLNKTLGPLCAMTAQFAMPPSVAVALH